MPEEALITVQDRARKIRLLILDVDGVLTDGRLYYASDGTELKAFHVHDGHGVKLLRRCGIECAVISGRNSPATARRLGELGVTHVYQGVEDKLQTLQAVLRDLRLGPEQAAHVGDDWPDLPVMIRVGLAVAVANADSLVKQHAHWVTRRYGGRGAVREVCEMLLQAQDRLYPLQREYLHTQ